VGYNLSPPLELVSSHRTIWVAMWLLTVFEAVTQTAELVELTTTKPSMTTKPTKWRVTIAKNEYTVWVGHETTRTHLVVSPYINGESILSAI